MEPKRCMLPSWLHSIWLVLLLVGDVLAQNVTPSNFTGDLPPVATTRFLLQTGPRSNIPNAPVLHLVPLTGDVAFMSNSDFLNVNVTAKLMSIGVSNASSIDSDTIAYISCDDDAYPGNLKASSAISFAINSNPPPESIVLYSTVYNHCTVSNPGYLSYDPIFTTVAPVDAGRVAQLIQNNTVPDGWSILPDTSAIPPSNSSSRGPSGNNAMIILYSITGIITALFLIIIVTGAIRAHRHPERYGPRNVIGRPRQSRAKGIARAMLETLPVVKFGDQEEHTKKVGGEGDIELGQNANRPSHERGQDSASDASPPPDATTDHTATGAAAVTPAATAPDLSTGEDNHLGCSICTEDFSKGEDLRVLPCNHRFHAVCVDPWLLNVSGTCPLCRVDLRPPNSSNPPSPSTEPPEPSSLLPPPLTDYAVADASTGPHPSSRRRDTIRSALNLGRMQSATPEERISALRALRHAARNRRSNIPSLAPSSVPEEGNTPQTQAQAQAGESSTTTQQQTSSSEPRSWRDRLAARVRR